MWASLFLQSKERERSWDLSLLIQTQQSGQGSSFRSLSLLWPCPGPRIVLSCPMLTGVQFDPSNYGTEIQLWAQFLAPLSRLRTFMDTSVAFSVSLFSGDNGGEGQVGPSSWPLFKRIQFVSLETHFMMCRKSVLQSEFLIWTAALVWIWI